MKTIRIVIASILIIIGLCTLPKHAAAVVCYGKTAVVYGNGMFSGRKDAVRSLAELRRRVLIFPQSYPYTAELRFYLAYADNGGATSPLSPAGLAQLYEAFAQKQAANDSFFWRWLGSIDVAPAWFKTLMTDLAANINANAYINDATLQQQLDGDPSNAALQPGYRTLLKQGDRIVVVAHSQGNFYANAAYDALVMQTPDTALRLGIVAVASPDNRVAGGGQHITVPEDVVITAIRLVYPATLIPSPAGSSSPNMEELGQASYEAATYGHSFVQWYLAGSFTRDFIMNAITQTTSALQKPFVNSEPAITSPVYAWNAFADASRCVLDDANHLGFHVNTMSNGYVFISVMPLLGTAAQPTTYSSYIPPVQRATPSVGREAIGILPVPSGVGIVYADAVQPNSYVFSNSNDDFAVSGTTSLHLISYTWDKTTGIWSEHSSQMALPPYTMSVTNVICSAPGGTWCSGPIPAGLSGGSAAYYSPVVYQNGLYDYGGEVDLAGFESDMVFGGYLDDQLTAPWLVVSVKNGQLAVGSSGVFTLLWDPATWTLLPTTVNVGVPGYIRLHGYQGFFSIRGIDNAGVTTQ